MDVLEESVERFVECDPLEYGDAESIERLERVLARIEAGVTKAVGAFDATGAWAPTGARTAGAWLVGHCGLAPAEAQRQVRRASHLRDLPAFTCAWSKGDISGDYVDVVVSVQRRATEAALERDQAMLAEQAITLAHRTFVGLMGYWEQHADPDGAEADAMERRARRDAYLHRTLNGMFLGRINLDDISGAIVSGEWDRLAQGEFDLDWAKAKEELGRDPRPHELARTNAQRRADALVEMATRSASTPEGSRRPEPLFSVLVGYDALYGAISQLEHGGGVIPPGTLLPWLSTATFERVVFAPGQRVEVSVTARFFTGATRRAIELRDLECTHPYCDRPAEQCQIDHIVPYTEGGETTQENGRVLCGFHNRLRNQRPPPDG